jgi:signal transduction histidine kinase
MMNNFDLTIVASIAAGILYLLVTGVILWRHGFQERTTRLLVFYVAFSGLWELGRVSLRLGWFPLLSDAALTRVTFYGMLVMSLLFLHLSRSFLRHEGAGWTWWGLGAVWVAALVVLDSNVPALPDVLWFGSRWFVARQQLVLGVLFLGWGVFVGGATLFAVNAYRRTRQPLHRNRITYWFLTLLLVTAGAVLLLVTYEQISSGLYLLSVFCAAYVALTYRPLDVRQAIRHTVSYLIATLLAVAVYTAGFLAAQYLSETIAGYTPLMAGAAIALVVVVFFVPLLRLVQRLVNRVLSGRGHDPGRTLREYSTRISNILDLERLAAVVVGLINEVIGVQHGVLFVVRHKQGESTGKESDGAFHLHGVKGTVEEGKDGRLSFVLPAESPVANYLRRERAPLAQYDLDLHARFQEISEAEREWWAGLDADIYLPIYAKEEWLGLLALGSKRSGDRYFDDEIALLSTLADQTAVALENTRLFENLKARTAEIERLNVDLATVNHELARMGKAKTDFIDIASHELRTPLTQVRGYTEILEDVLRNEPLTPEGGAPLINGLKIAAERLEEIVDTMFDVAKLDSETMTLHPARASVDAIIYAAVDPWRTALAERNITLTVADLASLPPIVADFGRLQQAFSHIIQNGIKYTPDGGEIRISGNMLEWTLPSDQAVEIIVADTGIGIAPDDLERIFDKFYRVGNVLFHSTGKIKFKGAGPGLGLTIARGIVEAHRGRIWAESPGCDEENCPGSEFHVVLPVRPRHLEPKSLQFL